MVKKLRLICFVLVVCLFGLTPVYANPLSNMGFQDQAIGPPLAPNYSWNKQYNYTDLQVSIVEDGTAIEQDRYLRLMAGYVDETNLPTEVVQDFTFNQYDTLSGNVRTASLYTGGYAYIKILLGEQAQFEYDIMGTEWLIKDSNGDPIQGKSGTYGAGWNLWTLTDELQTLNNNLTYTLVYGVTCYGYTDSSVANFDAVPQTNPLPEPATIILLMAGVLGIGIVRRKLN